MTGKIPGFNPERITVTRKHFLDFLKVDNFTQPERNRMRRRGGGSRQDYPDWIIMFIAVMAVKCQIKSYAGIHKFVVYYWEQIAEGESVSPISEPHLRRRLKKIYQEHGKPAGFIDQIFLSGCLD